MCPQQQVAVTWRRISFECHKGCASPRSSTIPTPRLPPVSAKADYYKSGNFSANHGATTCRRVSYTSLSLPRRSCSNVLCSPQSRMMLLTYTKQTKKESPLFVHSNLLDGRTIKYGQRFCKGELKTGWDNIEDITIQVGLRSRRALTLWSGWLYGREIWTRQFAAMSTTICGASWTSFTCVLVSRKNINSKTMME
jgi:hypothetical protein